MYLKIVRETSETRFSLDCYDISYFLSLYEGLALHDYIDGLYKADNIIKQEEMARQRELTKFKGG